MTLRHVIVTLLAAAPLATACVREVAPVAPGPVTEPRVSWTIRSGARGENEPDVCRSDRTQPCTLEAGTPARPMTVAVSVYMYAAGAPTLYSGAFQSGFIESAGAGGYETKVDYSIEPGRLPTGVTASGPVTSRPGAYEFRIALFANLPGQMDPRQFQQTIAVRVVRAGAASTQ